MGRREAEALRNPEVLRVEWDGGRFIWKRYFCSSRFTFDSDHPSGDAPSNEAEAQTDAAARKG